MIEVKLRTFFQCVVSNEFV